MHHLDNITNDVFSKIHVPYIFIDFRFRSKYVQRLTENRNRTNRETPCKCLGGYVFKPQSQSTRADSTGIFVTGGIDQTPFFFFWKFRNSLYEWRYSYFTNENRYLSNNVARCPVEHVLVVFTFDKNTAASDQSPNYLSDRSDAMIVNSYVLFRRRVLYRLWSAKFGFRGRYGPFQRG